MEIKLSEELSVEMFKHFKEYHNIIKVLNTEAYNLIHKYYNEYVQNKEYFLRPMKSDKFFMKMAEKR